MNRLFSLSVAAVLLTPSTPALAAPSAEPTVRCLAAGSGAVASADLLTLRLIDLRSLGTGLGPVVGVRVAPSRAGWLDQRAAAVSRLVDGNLIGVPGPPGVTAQQQAPPTTAQPATAQALRQNLGFLAVGDGGLSARATWLTGYGCGSSADRVAEANASLLDVAVLPGAGGRALVRVPENLASTTRTEVSRTASTATASVRVSDARVLNAVTVTVLSPPTLRAVATGSPASSRYAYTAPLLEVRGPVVGTHRLTAPGDHVEFGVPVSPKVLGAARVLADADGLPLLADGPFDALVRSLAHVDGVSATPVTGNLLGLPPLPGLPVLESALEVLKKAPLVRDLALVRVRLSIGEATGVVTAHGVTARATTVRLELTGRVGAIHVPLLDLGLGLLDVSAIAPTAPGASPYCGGPGCGQGGGLPVTGTGIGLIVGTAVLLIVAGRFLLLLGRRNGVLG